MLFLIPTKSRRLTIMLGDPAIITTMQDLKDSFGNPAANVKKEKKIL